MKGIKYSLFVSMQICFAFGSLLTNPLCQTLDSACLAAAVAPNFLNGYTPRLIELDNLKVDPFEIDYFKLDHDGLVFETWNTKGYGLRNMVIDEFSADANTSTFHVKFRTDMLVTGLYKTNGSLLHLPISGEGDYLASFKNVEIDVFASYRNVKNAIGEDAVQATHYNFNYDVKDNAEFRLNNLYYAFPGFSEMLHYVVNYNWKYISSQYAKDFIANAVENFAKTHKSYFLLEPLKFLVQ